MGKNNEKPAAFQMIKTVNVVKRVIDDKIVHTVDNTLTVPQAHLIGYIYKNKGKKDIFQKNIEEEFCLHKSSVSLMLNNMEQNGYIVRISDKSDGRLRKVELTPKAEELQQKISNEIHQVNDTICKNISPKDLKTFINVLSTMRKNLK